MIRRENNATVNATDKDNQNGRDVIQQLVKWPLYQRASVLVHTSLIFFFK